MHARSPRDRQHKLLLGVKWRFLSETVTDPVPTNAQPPWTNEARRRISYLERALASTHELEAQYQSFVQEATRSAPEGAAGGISLDWASTNALLAPGAVQGTVAAEFNPANDLIPSDPVGLEGSSKAGGARGRRAGGGDAPAGGGAHVEEDAEVSRVQQGAAEGSGAEADERGSPSPVIIWRHAAPVKIASNLPSDLYPPTQQAVQSIKARRASCNTRQKGPPLGGARAAASASVASELDKRRAAVSKRMQYGAWYLPTEKWSTRAQDAAGEAGRKGGRGSGAAGGACGVGTAAEGEAGDEEQNLTDTIPKLYSSRMYKDYLKSKDAKRLPHYLTRVEDSPKALSSRRGNIPMLDSPTAEGGADPASP